MGRRFIGLGLLVGMTTSSCVFFLDFDELEKGGSGGGAGSEAGATVPLEQAAAAAAKAICDRVRTCTGAALPLYLGDIDCDEFLTKRLSDTTFSSVQALPIETFEYHADLMPACLEATRNAPCNTFFPTPVECDAALEGKVDVDGSCTHPSECKRGFYCKIDTACPGVCAPKPGLNQPCADLTCLEGLTCDERLGSICVQLVQNPGEKCSGGTQPACELDMFCQGSTATSEGQCSSVSEKFVESEGEACAVAGNLCQAGLSCQFDVLNPTGGSGTCVQPSPANGPCTVGLPDPCPTGQYCQRTTAVVLTGTCADLPGDKEPCATDSAKAECAAGNTCVNTCPPPTACGTCEALRPLGISCSTNAVCFSGYCENGKCAAPNFCVAT